VIISVWTNVLTQTVAMLQEGTFAEMIRAFITNTPQRTRFLWQLTLSFILFNL